MQVCCFLFGGWLAAFMSLVGVSNPSGDFGNVTVRVAIIEQETDKMFCRFIGTGLCNRFIRHFTLGSF